MSNLAVTKRILVVDDEALTREVVEAILTGDDVVVHQAATGQQALDVAREERPDLVLLDMMMPGMDGIEVCRALRADDRTRHARIVMLTALDDGGTKSTAFAAGADDYLVKPFSARDLYAALDGA